MGGTPTPNRALREYPAKYRLENLSQLGVFTAFSSDLFQIYLRVHPKLPPSRSNGRVTQSVSRSQGELI